MAKLFTAHDPYHLHKIIGAFCLIHFFYRFYLLLLIGTSFPTGEDPSRSSACILLHGLLSWSSLLLPLPVKRNYSSPMIWPEFRLHSITFATRHVIATYLTLNDLWPQALIPNAVSRLTLLLGTVQMASWITDNYGDRNSRTTNAMPYPASILESDRAKIKFNYTQAQFAATTAAALPDPTLNFWSLLAIQLAALLMTLVRKGKIAALTYHRIYALALSIGYATAAIRIWQSAPEIACCIIWHGMWPQATLRMTLRMSSFMLWTLHVFITWVVFPLVVSPKVHEFEIADFSHLGVLFLVPSLWRQIFGYWTLLPTC